MERGQVMEFKKNYPLSITSLAQFISDVKGFVAANYGKRFFVNITVKEKKRNLPANAVYHTWFNPISDFMALTLPETTRYIKLEFGLPILLANKEFGMVIGKGLSEVGFFQMDYETKLLKMDKLPVTRLFDTKMHNKLRDDIQAYFAMQGLNLEYKK